MYLLRVADTAGRPFDVVGSSPEALVRVSGGTATSRPIAGTRPRSGDPAVDALRAEDLLADPKERAEHLMLVDLARNDLSRVCRPGSVVVSEYMEVDRFSHVLHLSSTVQGTLLPGTDAVDVLRATFPAGTLSGAPKIRAMEIIDELEPTRRGQYGGAVGYFDLAGDADLAIAIRTGLLRDGTLHVQAGAGIVADSVPATEHEECRTKAAAVLRAAHRASRMRTVDVGPSWHDGGHDRARDAQQRDGDGRA
jgi:anthranilate synthase component 1